MSKLRTVIVLCIAVCPLLLSRAQRPMPELPSGPMQAKVTTACAECHDTGIVVQQRLDKKAWGKEVDKMTKWGALVEPQERDAFIDYLSTNFPADKPPAAPQYKRPQEPANKSANTGKQQ